MVKKILRKIVYSNALLLALYQRLRTYRGLKNAISIIAKYYKRYFANIYYNSTVTILQSQNSHGPVILVSRQISYTFPLSYAYLAGYLIEKEIEVKVLFRDKDIHELCNEIIQLKPLIVGFGSLYPELNEVAEIVALLNKKGRKFPIVIGGQMVTPTPELAVRVTGAEYGAIGEGEIILYQLVRALQTGSKTSEIGGLVIRNGFKVNKTGKSEYINDLSLLPSIPYELFPVEQWLNIGRWYTQFIPEQPHWRFDDRVINVHGGRGCPFNCNFCYHHNKPRYRDITLMMKEAQTALIKFDGNMLYFSDDLVLASPKRAQALVSEIKKLDRKISYSVSTRFDILNRLSDELLLSMKETGCRIMGLGIESGSDRILKIIGKNVTSKQILAGLKRLKNVGILPTVSIMVGQYTENEEDVEESIKLLKQSIWDNPAIQYAFTVTTPFPGSKLYNILLKQKKINNDEEFFRKYFFGSGFGDWNMVVNLSKLSNKRVYQLRNKLDKIFIDEKRKALGDYRYMKINEIITRQRELFQQNIDDKTFRAIQKKLEDEKLQILGVQ